MRKIAHADVASNMQRVEGGLIFQPDTLIEI